MKVKLQAARRRVLAYCPWTAILMKGLFVAPPQCLHGWIRKTRTHEIHGFMCYCHSKGSTARTQQHASGLLDLTPLRLRFLFCFPTITLFLLCSSRCPYPFGSPHRPQRAGNPRRTETEPSVDLPDVAVDSADVEPEAAAVVRILAEDEDGQQLVQRGPVVGVHDSTKGPGDLSSSQRGRQ